MLEGVKTESEDVETESYREAIMLDPILRLPDVIKATGLSRSTIYEKIKNGEFPKPVKLGERSRGWRQSVIAGWINNREAA